jgi:hypothetical protein
MKKKEWLKIHLSNRLSYTLIFIGILIAVGVGVYAYGTSNPSAFGHSYNELQPCSGTQILKMNGAGAWACGSDIDTGIITETDPTVMSWAKNNNPTIPGTLTASGGRTAIYRITSNSCSNAGTLINAATCPTRLCDASHYYSSCTTLTLCGSLSAVSCSNTLLGYLV